MIECAKETAANDTVTLTLNPRLDFGTHYDQIKTELAIAADREELDAD